MAINILTINFTNNSFVNHSKKIQVKKHPPKSDKIEGNTLAKSIIPLVTILAIVLCFVTCMFVDSKSFCLFIDTVLEVFSTLKRVLELF